MMMMLTSKNSNLNNSLQVIDREIMCSGREGKPSKK